ncbi:MAG: hypothetical protein ACOCUW_01390 [Gemmatimonadota bacterium]
MHRPIAAIALVLALAGCDTGLEGNVPLQEAEHGAPLPLVAEVHARPEAPAGEVIMDGRLWVPWGRPAEQDDGGLRSVGSSHGATVFARAWDRAPYDALFLRTDAGAWQGYAPVIR